jgi:steroid delta-isomerase-like uncharacterized protein
MADNKAIVREYLDRAWIKQDLKAVDDLIAPDYKQHARNTPPGREGVKAFFAMLRSAFSGIEYVVEDMIAEGDRVAWRWTLKARHTGPFQGLPATGRAISLPGMSMVRMRGGMLAEHWGEQDMLGLLQQLGVLPGK